MAPSPSPSPPSGPSSFTAAKSDAGEGGGGVDGEGEEGAVDNSSASASTGVGAAAGSTTTFTTSAAVASSAAESSHAAFNAALDDSTVSKASCGGEKEREREVENVVLSRLLYKRTQKETLQYLTRKVLAHLHQLLLCGARSRFGRLGARFKGGHP